MAAWWRKWIDGGDTTDRRWKERWREGDKVLLSCHASAPKSPADATVYAHVFDCEDRCFQFRLLCGGFVQLIMQLYTNNMCQRLTLDYSLKKCSRTIIQTIRRHFHIARSKSCVIEPKALISALWQFFNLLFFCYSECFPFILCGRKSGNERDFFVSMLDIFF